MRFHLALFISGLFATLLIPACKDSGSKTPNDHPSPVSRSGIPKAIPRDQSIDAAHTYSDLQLDSSKLEAFIKHQGLNDTIAQYFRNFYNNRNYQFAWFATDGLTEQALAFSTLYNYSKDSSTERKWLDEQLEDLMNMDTTLNPLAADPAILRTELQMTWRFINYLDDRYDKEKDRTIALTTFVPARKQQPIQMAADLVAAKDKHAINPWYDALIALLDKYLQLQRTRKEPHIPAPKKVYKKGEQAPVIASVKKALITYTAGIPETDTSVLFDDKLEKAIRNFQSANGLKPDGKIQPSLVRELNTTPVMRIRQILVNLERMIWMPAKLDGDDNLILVNIPEFRLHVLKGSRQVFDMDIVVGKEGHSTVLFAGSLDRVSFNPYWNVPGSIVAKEVVPGMERNRHYLQEHEMEITGHAKGLPVVRQLPGPKNELGKMKFLFPNSFNIYLHDSPHKELFTMTRRAYSHGCIRVADAPKLAKYLLNGKPGWNDERIDSIGTGNRELTVMLQRPVPVMISYLTAWSGGDGQLESRGDIYGHDERLAKKLFTE